MREPPVNVIRMLTVFDAAGVARVLSLVAKAAWYLAFVVAALRVLADLLWASHAFQGAHPPTVRWVFACIVFLLDSLARSAAPAWVAFAFIWFFAAWFAGIARRQEAILLCKSKTK